MVLKARPGVCRKRLGGSDTLRRQVWQGGVVCFAVVHEDLGLTADTEMLSCALSGVGHGDEGDVGVG